MNRTILPLARALRPTRYLLAILLLPLLSGTLKADELTLSVSLGISPQEAARTYAPVLTYLGQATGKRVRLEVAVNSLAHWQMMRRENYDLLLDNPAFTAYRAATMGYTVVAKFPDVLSFTLAAHADEMVLDVAELIGRGVAVQPSPSLAGLRMEQLYPNPMRQPVLMQVDQHVEAARAVIEGRASGAILPTGLVGNFPDLNPIHTTEPLPAVGFSVSPRVTPELREALRRALLDAHETPAGRAMLEVLNIPYFEPATNATYAGLETMLEGVWGY